MQVKYASQSAQRMREYRKKWATNNRASINAAKRKRRLKIKLKIFKGKQCLNCNILMIERCKGVRIYCTSCVKNYPTEVRRHRWRRYYNRTKGRLDPLRFQYPLINTYKPHGHQRRK